MLTVNLATAQSCRRPCCANRWQFWLDTPLLTALSRLGLLSLVAIFTGHKTLRASAAKDAARGAAKKAD